MRQLKSLQGNRKKAQACKKTSIRNARQQLKTSTVTGHFYANFISYIMEGFLSINVWVAGRSYRIRVAAAEEAQVRNAVKKADEKITELRQHYAGKDDQDFVAMCLLMYATDKNTAMNDASISDLLKTMIAGIDSVLARESLTGGGNEPEPGR